MKPFAPFRHQAAFLRESKLTVADRETEVEVDLLPGGQRLDPGPLTLPVAVQVSDKPQILPLEKLISAKLSTYMGRGIGRRDFAVDPKVRDEYYRLCNALHQPSR